MSFVDVFVVKELKESISELSTTIESCLEELKLAVNVRFPKDDEKSSRVFGLLEDRVSTAERTVEALEARLSEEEALLEEVAGLREHVVEQDRNLADIERCLEDKLPPLPPPSPRSGVNVFAMNEFEEIEDDGESLLVHPVASEEEEEEEVPSASSRIPQAPPKSEQVEDICPITPKELEDVPKFMRGRVTLERVNAAVTELNGFLAAKYQLMAFSESKMSEIMRQKYVAFKQLENKETTGFRFFTESDMRTFSHLRLDGSGRSILSVLRSCGRIKQIKPVSALGNYFLVNSSH